MSAEIQKIIKLLQTLADNDVKFTVDDEDTVYVLYLDDKTTRILIAVLNARPDEWSSEQGKLRLWWD